MLEPLNRFKLGQVQVVHAVAEGLIIQLLLSIISSHCQPPVFSSMLAIFLHKYFTHIPIKNINNNIYNLYYS